MSNNNSSLNTVSLGRRLMAVFYDLMLLIAILFSITAIANALNHGKSIEPGHPYYPVFVALLCVISFFYYAWFWTRSGQTLGMQTWRIQLISNNHQLINWQQALTRALTALISWACVGLGFLWSLFNNKKLTWHDLLSKSMLIDLRDKK